MDQNQQDQLKILAPRTDGLEQKIDKLQHTIDRMNKIFLWTAIIAAALFILPLIGFLFFIPQIISGLSGYNSLLK
ncbi:MAG: hypothetical protein COU83_02345 [Candidatus Portnoybacteria bacterium CG10_big_fil_rev_8_21_14_0_10_40_22]|uniref:Uncharacterized protein n=1 Tax=Candidatus Portnoybacteria bacterium CG10_big_fil_rev_8_21_14_0_10_40_22 TaxID=1974814 RepID=A0A2M8KFM3_9BACT|nr:MAG: hypothetical protein COU83_02345 [Candidatus Portnoybacteria bacterium CG10_big_fil_rev_8_21_14_0_10_40_22]